MITTLICYLNWTNIFVNHFNVVYCLLVTLTTVTGLANVVSFLSVIIANTSGIIHNTSFNKKQLSKMRIGALDYLTREGYLSSMGLSRTGTSTHGYMDSLLEWLDLGESATPLTRLSYSLYSSFVPLVTVTSTTSRSTDAPDDDFPR
ncbi:hypothetical protein QFC20_007006 [Naganishia adeliensis]|uniref:Uncharacterized protein n=1 Tax=Naganishia adeliensis TaxID=92952 RepID=A0ACC2V4D5_9TREE|nr:hypothetical protein QFC20_007006 [Naganishia adeliensis]